MSAAVDDVGNGLAPQQYVSPQCRAANATLRERVGAARWVSEEELVSGRFDMRWKQKMAARL